MESEIKSRTMLELSGVVLVSVIASATTGTLVQYLLFGKVSLAVTFLVALITAIGVTRRAVLSEPSPGDERVES